MKTSMWQVKMRGKKWHAFRCGCCVAVNLKDEQREKEKKQEVKDFLTNQTL